MTQAMGILFTSFVNDETASTTGEENYLDSLDTEQKKIAGAYIDIETAYIIFGGSRKFSDLAAEYCYDDKQITLPGSNPENEKLLKNRGDVSLEDIHEFLEGIPSYEYEEQLHNVARKAAADKGYVMVDYADNAVILTN